MKPFDPFLNREWVAALRSGKYKQGTNALRGYLLDPDEDNYESTHCCLGVLCDMVDHDAWTPPKGPAVVNGSTYTWRGNTANIWAGGYCDIWEEDRLDPDFEFAGNVLINSEDENLFMGMNDSGDYTFDDIAYALEARIIGGEDQYR